MSLRGGGPPRRLVGRSASADDPRVDQGREIDPGPRVDDEYQDDVESARAPGHDGNGNGGRRHAEYLDDYAPYDDPDYFVGAERPAIGRGRREAKRRYSSRSGTGEVARFLLLAAVLATVVVGALLLVARPLATRAIVNWGAENRTALSIPFVADIVRGELGQYLTEPAGTDGSDVTFVVTQGETPSQIAAALEQAGLLKGDDAARAFVFQSIVTDAESKFLAGNHVLRATMTPNEVLAALQQPAPTKPILTITFREGLRIEQMVALLEAKEADPTSPLHALKLDPKAFYNLAEKPVTTELAQRYPFLSVGKSLEGFLFPATYQLYADTTPDELVQMLLDAFQHNAPAQLLAMKPDQIYSAVTIASLVETEAKVNVERPLIAGVYVNRLNGGKNFPTKLLQADPTVNYANDSIWLAGHPLSDWKDYTFWNRIQGQYKDFVVPSNLAGYQTYKNPGLPPTPICSPSAASLNAAVAPDTASGYYYFVATGDSEGTHAFAKTYAEFQALLQKYQYTP